MKRILMCISSVICAISLFTSCNEENYPGPNPVEVTANYSNQLTNGTPNLILTYSGEALIGKSVDFSTVKGEDANITLYNIIPGDETLKLTNVPLVGDEEGYSFSGNSTTARNISFKYEGRVTKGKLTLNVSEVKMPDNVLAGNGGNGTWYIVHNGENVVDKKEGRVTYQTLFSSAYVNTNGATLTAIMGGFGTTLLNNIFSTSLNDITFQPDGNIVAHYAGMPEGVELKDILPNNFPDTGGTYIIDRPITDYHLSGNNLAYYYMESDSVFYVIPNVDMIIQQIQKDKQLSRSNTLDNVQILYDQLIIWTTKGIKFKLSENPNKNYTGSGRFMRRQKGDCVICIDNSETKCLVNVLDLLPVILQMAGSDLLEKTVGELAGEQFPSGLEQIRNTKLGDFLDLIKNEISTSSLEIGLYFNKSNINN